MGEPEFREAERAHGSLLAPLEKRCLVWLAERMPPWVNSDHLTLLGFIAMMGVGLCYWTARRHPMALLVGAFFLDRKSTRLNSSHVRISYAVFCLKKKKYRRNRYTSS